MGNSSIVTVQGKGRVLPNLASGKTLELNNVLHVPDIRRNLLSDSLLNKAGVKLTIESDKLVLTKNGNFVGKDFCNARLFVLDVETINKNISPTVYIAESVSLWHARLGNVNVGPNLHVVSCSSSHESAPVNELVEPRRGKRVRTTTSFGPDFVTTLLTENLCLSEHDINVFILEEDPRTYIEAMQSVDSSFWREVINSKIESIISNNTWVLKELPSGCKTLSNKWVFKRKLKLDGPVDKFKARLVVCGNLQTKGLDFFDTYSPVTKVSTIRALVALASAHNLVIDQMDVKTAFLNGDLHEQIYMKQPEDVLLQVKRIRFVN
ncbi:uncharacterized protein LOC141649042 [Silene latifolia]|uniref:uncharacterized protein LOC141649042 n=1 Tax=Silene latifolia TaxID=37657 RepID=UPI003D7774CC